LLARSPRKRRRLAEASSVPAGIYAREHLTRIGLWEQIAPKVVPTENARAALAAVKAGNVEAAIVYATDAKGLLIKDGPKISYPFGLLRNSRDAKRFFDYLRSRPALDVFARHGFLIQ
jgi:molybdate transport system substrate-binding protein